ncbi:MULTISPECIES: hypothetical protein [Pseudomonas]|uniref:hypothetical protein n=1 Tax=Pseudomonas TaxID=286 RepID=UPI001F43D68F|nr:hypothetical protein [Pseudomonas sputi]
MDISERQQKLVDFSKDLKNAKSTLASSTGRALLEVKVDGVKTLWSSTDISVSGPPGATGIGIQDGNGADFLLLFQKTELEDGQIIIDPRLDPIMFVWPGIPGMFHMAGGFIYLSVWDGGGSISGVIDVQFIPAERPNICDLKGQFFWHRNS